MQQNNNLGRYLHRGHIVTLLGLTVASACSDRETTGPKPFQANEMGYESQTEFEHVEDEGGVVATGYARLRIGISYVPDTQGQLWAAWAQAETIKTGSPNMSVYAWAMVTSGEQMTTKSCTGSTECVATAAHAYPCLGGGPTVYGDSYHELRLILTNQMRAHKSLNGSTPGC